MQRKRFRIIVILLAIAVSAALAACGQATSGSGAGPGSSPAPGACSAPTVSVADVQRGGEPLSRAPLAVPVTTLPPGVTVGQVQVVVESGDYGPQSTIFVWAGNGLSQCIYATDHQSDCSIVVLERRVNGGWQPQAKCPLATPTRIVALPPMQAAFVRLAPAAAGAWQTGSYRVAFTYRLDVGATGQAIEVDSTPFAIR